MATDTTRHPQAPMTGVTTPPASARAAGHYSALDWIALALMIVGGLNWGLVGAFNLDVVALLFGPMTVLTRAVYVLVGLAAIYGIVMAMRKAQHH